MIKGVFILREKREITANVVQTFLRTKQKVIMTMKAWCIEDDLLQDNSTEKIKILHQILTLNVCVLQVNY